MYNRGPMLLGVMAAAGMAGAVGMPMRDPVPVSRDYDGDRRKFVYRDTKPHGPTNDQRKAKRKMQQASRRKNRK